MFIKLSKRLEEHSENFIKELENIRKKQSKLKNTMNEMKTTLEGINSRLHDVKEVISSLGYRNVEIPQSKQQREKRIFK